MTVYAHDASSGQTNEYPELEAKFGEDPARFLESNELMATARIAGIRDPELLEAYEPVAEEITAGNYRTTILEAIADRKADLGLETDAPTPDATADPVPATDGGQQIEDDADEEPDPLHPDVKGLEAGEVLVLERGDAREYVFPATADAAEPYLCRSFDAEGDERTAEPIGMSFDEVLSRLDGSPDPVPVEEIDVDAPRGAATNGGDA